MTLEMEAKFAGAVSEASCKEGGVRDHCTSLRSARMAAAILRTERKRRRKPIRHQHVCVHRSLGAAFASRRKNTSLTFLPSFKAPVYTSTFSKMRVPDP